MDIDTIEPRRNWIRLWKMRRGEKQEVQEIKSISSRAKSLKVETIVSSVFLTAIKSTSNDSTFFFYIELKYVQKNCQANKGVMQKVKVIPNDRH